MSKSILRDCILRDVLPISLYRKPRNLRSYTFSGYWQVVELCDLRQVTHYNLGFSLFTHKRALSLPLSPSLSLPLSQRIPVCLSHWFMSHSESKYYVLYTFGSPPTNTVSIQSRCSRLLNQMVGLLSLKQKLSIKCLSHEMCWRLTVHGSKGLRPSTARPCHCRCGIALSNKSRKTQSSSEAWQTPVKGTQENL